MDTLSCVVDYLQKIKIPFKVVEGIIPQDTQKHKDSKDSLHAITKSLLLTDKRKSLYLVTLLTSSTLDLKQLSKQLCTSNLRYGNLSHLANQFNSQREGVSIFLLRHLGAEHIRCVLDSSLKDQTGGLYFPLTDYEQAIQLTLPDLLRFIEAAHHQVRWINFTECSTEEKNTVSVAPCLSKVSPTSSFNCGANILGLTARKHENFSEWYSQLIVKAELVEYYDISGCYVLRPGAYFIWEEIQGFINQCIKRMGVDNCYFPMFVTKKKLEVEKEHVAGFSPEVAWVCRYGESELNEPIAIRPTSETILYPTLARWIRSHRDLPMKLNQWCPIVRWEFRQPTPFIRTREFLWQEGHTAHATRDEAEDLMKQALAMYIRVYKELLAVPVISGLKSEGEKFSGAEKTSTVEAFVAANGRAIQAATSHLLGTKFSRMFNIQFEDRNKEKQYVHQTSWGLTTRSLGVLIMIHGDDKGMVIPPRVAPIQVVIIPIITKESFSDELTQKCNDIAVQLSKLDIRVKVDDRDCYTAGWKYNYWEVKGVCLRLEVGPRDIKQKTVRIVRRDTAYSSNCPWEDISTVIPLLLETIHSDMFHKAERSLKESIVQATTWDEIIQVLSDKKMVLVPWSEDVQSEELIKKESVRLATLHTQERLEEDNSSALSGAMKPLCIPFDQPPLPENAKCFATGMPAQRWCLFGRSY